MATLKASIRRVQIYLYTRTESNDAELPAPTKRDDVAGTSRIIKKNKRPSFKIRKYRKNPSQSISSDTKYFLPNNPLSNVDTLHPLRLHHKLLQPNPPALIPRLPLPP